MRRLLRLGEPAAAELSEAVRWYETRRPGLGGELLEAVARALDMLAESAELGSPVPAVASGRLRRLMVQRFPYQIIYELRSSEIVVIAIAHLKRHPGYWKTRV